MNRNNFLIFFILSTIIFNFVNSDIAYPADDLITDKTRLNADGRKPVWIPGRCAENEILYPGDNANDWICDCKPAFIFHPDTGSCYIPYSQGPCEDGKYIILKKNRVVPECADNPCKTGEVKYKNNCQPYGKADACNSKLSELLEIDAVSLRPKCVRRNKSPLLSLDIESFMKLLTTTNAPISVGNRYEFGSDETKPAALIIPEGATEVYKNAPWCQKGTKRRIINRCSEN